MYDHMSGWVAAFLSSVAIRLKIEDIGKWYAYKYCREIHGECVTMQQIPDLARVQLDHDLGGQQAR